MLTRSFVRTALQYPPSGLADELRHFYLTRGRLKAVIDHAERLMAKGEAAASGSGGAGENGDEENAEMWNADAMGSLTKGAIISLRVSRLDAHDATERRLIRSAPLHLWRSSLPSRAEEIERSIRAAWIMLAYTGMHFLLYPTRPSCSNPDIYALRSTGLPLPISQPSLPPAES